MRRILLYCIAAFASFSVLSCEPEKVKGSTPDTPTGPDVPIVGPGETVSPDPASGISVDPAVPDADKSCTIRFRPGTASPLYGNKGDLYAHLGIIVPGDDRTDWSFVPYQWTENNDRCKFKSTGSNEWELELTPSIREFFKSGETPLGLLAILVRSADGELKSGDDQFCTITDNKYQAEEFVPDSVEEASMPAGAKYGINYNSDGSVTFVLYEKNKGGNHYKYCYIVGDWNGWTRVPEGAMKRDESAGCWWITLSGFDRNTEYRFQYRLGTDSGSDIRVSDPYTEIVYDQWNDQYIPGTREFPDGAKALISAFQINRPSYSWKNDGFKIADRNNLVIYEMHLRDFTESQNLAGAKARLDYIQGLGVNAIELMPVQDFDGNNSWGYNPNHYFALDKYYGTREQYKEFIDECHGRGIAVIFDVVYNHATGAHTWAKMYWDSANERTAASNPWFNAIATHPYNVYHDFNHENTMVKDMVKGSLQYLLKEYKVDGFRFDLTKGFTQNNSGSDVAAWGHYDASRVAILKDYADAVWEVNSDAAVIFEHLSDWDEEKVLAEYGIQLWRNCNGAYRTAASGSNADFSNMYSTAPFGGFVGYMESHDEERLCYGLTEDASSITWGICGTLTNWGATASDKDISMTADDVFYVARNVTFKASDMFKIRGNGEWNDAYNYGASAKGYKLPLNTQYTMTLGSSSQDMAVPAAGTYDVYFCPEVKGVWLMETGKRPEAPQVSGSADKLGTAMRRAGCDAAFFLLVPGPKMIWQFGEIGYDYSINYNERTGEKPVVTDAYLAVPERKALYDTYAGLLGFRNANPEFFTKDADFRWQVTTAYYPGKYIYGSTGGKHFAVAGNFGKGSQTITVDPPVDGPFHNWFDSTETYSGDKFDIVLKEGEWKLLVDF